AEALNRYEHELRIRGADVNNVARVRKHLPDALARKNVALLRPDDLRRWRNELIAELAPATVNRTSSMLPAACNLAAVNDDRITNQHAWRSGLAGIPDVELSRNVILDEPTVRRIIAKAYQINAEFGLLCETAAVSGARVGQIARLRVGDLKTD